MTLNILKILFNIWFVHFHIFPEKLDVEYKIYVFEYFKLNFK